MKALAGITVVSLEQAVAAPLASRHLADLGARVIKVERSEGDFARFYDRTVLGMSSYFTWLNRSKASMTLNLKHVRAHEVLRRLTERADVVIENLGPRTLSRLGFDLDDERRANPRLITCAISGYGHEGPYADRKAYDLLLQAESGLVSITGSPEAPARVGISIGDIAAGMYAFSSILVALMMRATTGRGTHVDVTILEALSEWLGAPWYHASYGGKPMERAGTRHATIAPYGDFRCSDGDVVFLSVQNDREWQRFCEQVLLQPTLAEDVRFADNPARVLHRAELRALIDRVFETMGSGDVKARLQQAQIAYADSRSIVELAEHPQLVARRRVSRVESPSGTVRALLPPFNIDGHTPTMERIPARGEHTQELLRELGYSDADIQELQLGFVV